MVLSIGTHAVLVDNISGQPKHSYRPFMYAYMQTESADVGKAVLTALLLLVQVTVRISVL